MNIKKRVKDWRRKNGYINKKGVVVVCDDAIQGWVDSLRDARHWKPGCIAMLENENTYIAVGGNDTDGAKEWNPL